MASNPIKRAGYYQVRWRFQGQWQSAREQGFEDANALADWLDAMGNQISAADPRVVGREYLHGHEIAMERAVAAGAVLTFGRAGAELIDRKRAEVAERTLRRYDIAFRLHAGDLADLPLEQVNHNHLNAHYRALKANPRLGLSTVVATMAIFTEMLSWAYGRELTTFDPARARKGKRLEFKTTAPNATDRSGLTWAQVQRLLAEMPTQRDHLITWMLASSGGRISEVLALNVGDVDFTRGTVWFGHHMLGSRRALGTKGSRGKPIPPKEAVAVSTALLTALADYVGDRAAGEPLFPYVAPAWRPDAGAYLTAEVWRGAVFTPVRDRLHAAGILPEGVSPHWLRHTTGSRLGDLVGAPLIKTQLRHATLAQSDGYLHPDPATIAAIRLALDTIETGDARSVVRV